MNFDEEKNLLTSQISMSMSCLLIVGDIYMAQAT